LAKQQKGRKKRGSGLNWFAVSSSCCLDVTNNTARIKRPGKGGVGKVGGERSVRVWLLGIAVMGTREHCTKMH